MKTTHSCPLCGASKRHGGRCTVCTGVVMTTRQPASITDAALYDRFKAASSKEATEMLRDPKIGPRLRAESARRHK